MTAPDLGGLSCKEVVELVTDYLEGALSVEIHARFERHLGACPPCVTYVEQIRQTITTLGRLPEETIEQPVMDTLLQHFRGWSRGG